MSGRYERELVNAFHAAGWGAMRCPASGAASERGLPDVLVGKPIRVGPASHGEAASRPIAIEHKYTSSTTAYVDGDEVPPLREFASRFGAEPRLAVRFTSQASPTAHYLVKPEDARMTDGGAYGLPLDDIEQRATEVVRPDDEVVLKNK